MNVPRRRRVMEKFTISEISGVDVPAQAGARSVIMKRHDGDEDEDDDGAQAVQKAAAFITNAVEGHSHLLVRMSYDGKRLWGQTTHDAGHSHPWVALEDDSVLIGEAYGHRHNTEKPGLEMMKSMESFEAVALTPIMAAEMRDMLRKSFLGHFEGDTNALESLLSDLLGEVPAEKIGKKETENMSTELLAKMAQMEKDLAKANSLAGMSDTHKTYFKGMTGAGADGFLSMDQTARQVHIDGELAKSEASDPLVYTTSEGVAIRKSAGDTILAMAKSHDVLLAKSLKREEHEADEAITKQAEALRHLPGDLDTRKALVKAATLIPDEVKRKAALQALAAQDVALKAAFLNMGVSHGGQEFDTEASKLDAMAKAHAEKVGVSFAKAYDYVLGTAEGSKLYAASQNG
jgi:hypothetical protein